MQQYLDQATMNAYSDLLAACRQPAFDGTGLSFSTKSVRGKSYVYTNTKVGRVPVQRYLGPDNAETHQLIEKEKSLWAQNEKDQKVRARLVDMVLAGGMRGMPPQEGKILRMLERAGVFLAGGILVGTPAFNAIGAAMGVNWSAQFETRDMDIAVDNPLPVAIGNDPIDLKRILEDSGMGFIEIPMLNRKSPATSFKITGGEYIVELLTPERGKPAKGPIHIHAFNAAAEPLRYLDYLLEEVQSVALPYGIGILVNVPDPARFALHKLVVSQRRSSIEIAKSAKDVDQAQQLLEILMDTRPGAVYSALEAAESIAGKFIKQMRVAAKRLPPQIATELLH
ncbi:hypothetical protein HBA55_00865 [Pseudomaricurvus alkylphenolicus]|uniref:GSU2403 family nucleotidyltransferase fold protein n=1 Tax=Pseudomaricurvus alkylphenolicus TaxID=1306991 RepID=UPI001422DCA3|nr:GSU2403 family nucleotidyltransferase fold protein [Pseudomaricurvus alkylphenolicus]NIB38112.1 hypothetical protein [Pseudomaricurvus alkylphenolicus]